jgi:hypothetical protein
MIVVEDLAERVMLWRPRGTVRKAPIRAPELPHVPTRTQWIMEALSSGEWVFRDHEWDVDNLWLMRPQDWSAIWVGWRPSNEPWGWYVNLQRPFTRTPWGFQMMDLMLDVVVGQDRTWRWKDEDDFQGLLDYDLIDDATAARVRHEAARVIANIEANRPPFCDEWHAWRPDPAWGIPRLPTDWERF